MVDRKDVDFESVFAKISPGISDPIYLALGRAGGHETGHWTFNRLNKYIQRGMTTGPISIWQRSSAE
jgi:hypothetical protein